LFFLFVVCTIFNIAFAEFKNFFKNFFVNNIILKKIYILLEWSV